MEKYYRTLARFSPYREDDCLLICFPAWNSNIYHLVQLCELPDEIKKVWDKGNYHHFVCVTLGAENNYEFSIDHNTWEVFDESEVLD